MEDVLRGMFREFNKKVDGNYYVNILNQEIQFAQNGGCGKICDLSEVEMVSFNPESEVIFLEAQESWGLTKNGPEF